MAANPVVEERQSSMDGSRQGTMPSLRTIATCGVRARGSDRCRMR